MYAETQKYDETWKGKDESHNVAQKHDIELAKERLRVEVRVRGHHQTWTTSCIADPVSFSAMIMHPRRY